MLRWESRLRTEVICRNHSTVCPEWRKHRQACTIGFDVHWNSIAVALFYNSSDKTDLSCHLHYLWKLTLWNGSNKRNFPIIHEYTRRSSWRVKRRKYPYEVLIEVYEYWSIVNWKFACNDRPLRLKGKNKISAKIEIIHCTLLLSSVKKTNAKFAEL